MKKWRIVLLILVCAVSGFAQQRKPVETKPKPAANTETKKTTADAAKPNQNVIVEKLNGDKISGLFVSADVESLSIEISGVKVPIKFSEIKLVKFNAGEDSPVVVGATTPSSQPKNSTINIEAAIIYRSGQVVPVARTTFYLLDDDLITILKTAGVQPTASTSRMYQDYGKAILTDIGFAVRYGSLPDYQRFGSAVAEAIKPHIKYTFQTDFSGKAILSDAPPGKFFLFGIGATRQSGVVWNMAIDTTTNQNLVLDANNAAFAY